MANYLYMGGGAGGGGGGGGLQETVIAEVSGIDFASTGITPLYSPATGRSAIVTKAFFFTENTVGLTGTLEAGIGFNANSDNILPSIAFTGFDDSPQQLYVRLVEGVSYVAVPGDTINLGIDTAFGGTAEGTVVLFGFEVNN